MDPNKAVILITERCKCKDNPPPANDGYAVHKRVRCIACFDTGLKRTQLSLTDLKTLLDSLGNSNNPGNSGQ